MKIKVCLFALAVFFGSAAVCAAQSPQMGTWKLNEAKSKIAKGSAKNTTVTYEASGDMTKVTVEGVDGSGGSIHNEWTGKFDGKYYDDIGSPTGDKRSYRRVNSRTLSMREKKGNSVVMTVTITVAANGKSRTVVSDGTDAAGKHFHTVAVYDKQ